MKRIIMLCSIFLLLVPLTAIAQDFCEGNFDYDQDVDGSDASIFKSDFGRSSFSEPCPTCAPLRPVAKTGQTNCYDENGNPRDCAGTGEDADYQLGYTRLVDNGDGTITDNFTGLIWLKDANCIATNYPAFDQDHNSSIVGDGAVTWQHALDFVAGINDGSYSACRGNPLYVDWRLPNINELISMPPFPNDFPFDNMFSFSPAGPRQYWSSTTLGTTVFPDGRMVASIWVPTNFDSESGGFSYAFKKTSDFSVLPVRGGK